ncbi:MAG: radical SAM protein [Nitrospirales bacterium]
MATESIYRNEDQKCCYRAINSQGVRVLWEITSACNVECDFCLVEKKHRTIPLRQAMDLAAVLIEEGVEKFLISGGEPLLYPGIESLLEFLVGRGVLVKLLTNGTIHNPRIFDLIQGTPQIEVSLSVQSINEEMSDRIFKRKGSWAKLLETIRLLPKDRLNIITTFSTMNYDHIEEIIDWVVAQGIRCLSITNVFQETTRPARFMDSCLMYKEDAIQINRLFELIVNKRQEYEGRLIIRTTQFGGEAHETCEAGRSVLYVDSTGALLPCTLTNNAEYRELNGRLSVKELVRHYRERLPSLPPSSCVPLFSLTPKNKAVAL